MFNLFKKQTQTNNLSQDEWQKLLKETKGAVIIDVRSPQECRSGIIPGAKNINFFSPNFKSKVAELDNSKSYFVYCRSGNRSGKACAIMSNLGFENAYNLVGGMMRWNGPVSKFK